MFAIVCCILSYIFNFYISFSSRNSILISQIHTTRREARMRDFGPDISFQFTFQTFRKWDLHIRLTKQIRSTDRLLIIKPIEDCLQGLYANNTFANSLTELILYIFSSRKHCWCVASRFLPVIIFLNNHPLPQRVKRRNQLIMIFFLLIPDMPHAEDGILHAAAVGADPHGVFVRL